MYVSQLVLPQTNTGFIDYPEWFEKSTWVHYCLTGWVSNCDRQYLALAFSTSSFIQCNIVYNKGIEPLFIWRLLYFGWIVKPCWSQIRLKGDLCFYFKFIFFHCAIFAIFQKNSSSNKLIYYYVVWIYHEYINIEMFCWYLQLTMANSGCHSSHISYFLP